MEKQSSVGEWLKQKCEEEHLTLRQAAAKADLSHSTLADIMKGGHPSAQTIRKLTQGFGGGGELADYLYELAGYRMRPDKLSEALAQLIDKVQRFSDPQLKVMARFADFLTEIS